MAGQHLSPSFLRSSPVVGFTLRGYREAPRQHDVKANGIAFNQGIQSWEDETSIPTSVRNSLMILAKRVEAKAL
jgi:hypothetical protein